MQETQTLSARLSLTISPRDRKRVELLAERLPLTLGAIARVALLHGLSALEDDAAGILVRPPKVMA